MLDFRYFGKSESGKTQPVPPHAPESSKPAKALRRPKEVRITLSPGQVPVKWRCSSCHANGMFSTSVDPSVFLIALGIHRTISPKCHFGDATLKGEDGVTVVELK